MFIVLLPEEDAYDQSADAFAFETAAEADRFMERYNRNIEGDTVPYAYLPNVRSSEAAWSLIEYLEGEES